MNPWNNLQEKVSPAAFARGCLILAAVWMLFLYPLLIWLCPGILPEVMAPRRHIDFYQYYGGAVAVRDDLWDSLYPVPLLNVYDQPSHFTPKYKTFLFNQAYADRTMAFYPELNAEKGSQWPPRLKAAFPEAQSYSYIYPPPTALLCAPLSLFSFDAASNRIWPTVSIWFLFVMTFYTAQIHRLIRGGATYAEGWIILACILFTTQGETHITDGNVSPILGGCIACCAYALIRSRMLVFSSCYVVLILFKSLGLSWLALLLFERRYWRALGYLAIITVVLNAIVLAVAGTQVYAHFFALAPYISIPVGVGLVVTLLNNFGFFSLKLYLFLEVVLIGLLYYGLWKNRHADAAQRALLLPAFLAGTMAVFCLLNFIVCAVYLFFPFLGWMVCEAVAARGIWRIGIVACLVLSFAMLNGAGAWYLLFGAGAMKTYTFGIMRFYVMFIPVFFLVVSLRRMLFWETSAQQQRVIPPSTADTRTPAIRA